MSSKTRHTSLFSQPLTRRHFIAAGATLVGSRTFAAGTSGPSPGVDSALIVGTGSAADRAGGSWGATPTIRQLFRADDLQVAVQVIRAHRPDLMMVTDPATAPALLNIASASGLRGAYLDLPQSTSDVLAECKRISQLQSLKVAAANPLRYSRAYAAFAERVESGALGRLLEIRCAIHTAAGMTLNRCRQSIALAVASGGLPRSCYARFYRGAALLSNHLASSLKRTGTLSSGSAFYASWPLACGLSFHLDCGYSPPLESGATRVTFLGTRGIAQITDGSPPTGRWKEKLSGADVGSAAAWQPLASYDMQSTGLAHETESAHIALLDLIGAIENDRPPISSLAHVCAADSYLNTAIHSHCLQQRVDFPNHRVA